MGLVDLMADPEDAEDLLDMLELNPDDAARFTRAVTTLRAAAASDSAPDVAHGRDGHGDLRSGGVHGVAPVATAGRPTLPPPPPPSSQLQLQQAAAPVVVSSARLRSALVALYTQVCDLSLHCILEVEMYAVYSLRVWI